MRLCLTPQAHPAVCARRVQFDVLRELLATLGVAPRSVAAPRMHVAAALARLAAEHGVYSDVEDNRYRPAPR